jgi:hypothetical protein
MLNMQSKGMMKRNCFIWGIILDLGQTYYQTTHISKSIMDYFKIYKTTLLSVIFALSVVIYAHAQSINIVPKSVEIERIIRSGYQSCIELDRKTVEREWSKKAKGYGKIEALKGGVYIGRELVIPEFGASPVQLFSQVEATSKCTNLFIALQIDGKPVDAQHPSAGTLQQYLKSFTVELYRNDLTAQIEEAEKTVDKAVKVHDKMVKEGDNIRKRIEKNASEKVKLEKQLKDNAAEKIKLENQLSKNATDQESALEEIKKVRKIAEEKKAKLATVQ